MSLFYEIFLTIGDDRTCGQCRPHHGQIYRTDMGPVPPLHPLCRCERVFIDIEEPNWRRTKERMLDWHEARVAKGQSAREVPRAQG